MLGINIFFTVLIFAAFVRADETCRRMTTQVPESTIHRLFELVAEGQVRTEAPVIPGKTHIRSKGSYKCAMKVHNVGGCMQTAQRWAININEHNTFVSMWISIILLEASHYSKAPRPSDEQLISTLEFCRGFIDVTKAYNSSLLTFWQCIADETHQGCITRPHFYVELMNIARTKPGKNFVDKSNLANVLKDFSDILRLITGFDNSIPIFTSIFKEFESSALAPDADDSFVWLIFGSMLKMLEDEFPEVSSIWIQYNPNISSIFDAVKKYAYRPFSKTPFVNTIDPETYYVLRNFLNDAKIAGNDVALVTTLFTNAGERPEIEPGSILNKLVNDIDATVCSNAVNAITSAILSGLISPQVLLDKEISQIYQNTSAMLAYLINTNFTNRPDLALLYYPSKYQLYWTVARTVSMMDIYLGKADFPAEVMKLVYSNLKGAMEGEATRFLLTNAKYDNDGALYFDDFLGNGDISDDNQPIIRGEDRIFTTAIAANILMYTWLSFNPKSTKSNWKTATPDGVKQTVGGCIQWLVNNIFQSKFKPWNVFFSAQNKGRHILPFRYPANYFIELPQAYPFQYVTALQTVLGVQGYIPKDDYDAMLKTSQFGQPVPTVFNGFNDPDSAAMLFWNSEPYTYAEVLLALSRYREVDVTNESSCL